MKNHGTTLFPIFFILIIKTEPTMGQIPNINGIWIGDKIFRTEKKGTSEDNSSRPVFFNSHPSKAGFFISILNDSTAEWFKFYEQKDTVFEIKGNSLFIEEVSYYIDKSKLPDSLFLIREFNYGSSRISLYKGQLNSKLTTLGSLKGYNLKIHFLKVERKHNYEIYFTDSTEQLFFTNNLYSIPTRMPLVEYFKTEIDDKILISF